MRIDAEIEAILAAEPVVPHPQPIAQALIDRLIPHPTLAISPVPPEERIDRDSIQRLIDLAGLHGAISPYNPYRAAIVALALCSIQGFEFRTFTEVYYFYEMSGTEPRTNCANFVSFCMYRGGFPVDDEWKLHDLFSSKGRWGSGPWISVPAMRNYFIQASDRPASPIATESIPYDSDKGVSGMLGKVRPGDLVIRETKHVVMVVGYGPRAITQQTAHPFFPTVEEARSNYGNTPLTVWVVDHADFTGLMYDESFTLQPHPNANIFPRPVESILRGKLPVMCVQLYH